MTTGTKIHGSTVPVWTDAGKGTGLIAYGQKSWSGSDSTTSTQRQLDGRSVSQERHTFADVRNGFERVLLERDPPRIPLPRTRKKVKRAYHEEHPYTMSVTTTTDLPFERRGHPVQPWGTALASQAGYTSEVVSYGWSQANDYRLLSKLQSRVSGSNFDAGVFLGEGREALRMIHDAATRISGAVYAFRRGRLDYAARILTRKTDREAIFHRKNPASNWLELQYGWLPLLGDAHDGAQFLAHRLNVPLTRTCVVTEKSAGYVVPANSSLVSYPGSYARRSVRIKAIIRENKSYSLTGLIDPFTIGWELLPWSFVVDWFIPIGNFLQARGLSNRLVGTFVTSTKTEYFIPKIVPALGSTTQFKGTCPYSKQSVNLTRSISTSLNVKMPEFKRLGDVPSWKRAANAVSLLVMRLP